MSDYRQQNEELHQRTVEVLKKLSVSNEPVAYMSPSRHVITTNIVDFPAHISPVKLYVYPKLTPDDLALLMYHCGITKEDLK